jgi:hypothetical protein
VRSSTKDFIKGLTEKENWKKFGKTEIKKSIENSNWFFLSWKNDPTVLAILNMLDLIENIFKDTKVVEFNKITFELLKLNNFKLTDELYVKMNARGKPLTEFENFKAEFEKYIKDNTIKAKLDNVWLDIFWKIAQGEVKDIKEAPKKADEMFYNFFYNVTFNFYLENKDKLECKINNKNKEFNKIEDFVKECNIFDFYNSVYENDEYIKKVIFILDNLQKNDASKEFKIFIDKKEISQWERARFYALSLGYIHNLDDKEFPHWKRISFNLINNQLMTKDGLIKTINSLKNLINNSNKNIYNYIKDDSKKIEFFNKIQKEEESIKAKLIEENIVWEGELKSAESINYLDGQIGFLLKFANNDIEEFVKYRDKFETLWNFSKDNKDSQILIYQALLTKGNYLPEFKSNYTFCSFDEKSLRVKEDNWRKVFNSDNKSEDSAEIDKKLCLKSLLDDSNFNIKDIKTSLEKIISNYAFKCNEPLSYFIKNKSYIEYCKELQIRFKNKDNILLLKRERISGRHAELYTYDLYTKEFKGKNFASFKKSDYYSVCENKEELCVLLPGLEIGKYKLHISYKNKKYVIRLYEENYNSINIDLVDILTNHNFDEKEDENGKYYRLETKYNCCQNEKLIEFLEKLTVELKDVTI